MGIAATKGSTTDRQALMTSRRDCVHLVGTEQDGVHSRFAPFFVCGCPAGPPAIHAMMQRFSWKECFIYGYDKDVVAGIPEGLL
jgi:hypothetical protein